MPFTTYAELQTAVLDRMDRNDDLTSEVTDWITLAEEEICDWLRVSWTEKRAYATPTSAFVAVPTDFNGLRNLQWDYQNYRLSLQQVSPDLIDKVVASTTSGVPVYFCMHDGQFELRPAPAADNTTTVEISYYFKPTPLSDSNTSNEILENIPRILFYRVLAEGFSHLFDEEREAKYLALYEKGKRELLKNEEKVTWGGNPLRVVADSMRLM